jgi:hypothetical protein
MKTQEKMNIENTETTQTTETQIAYSTCYAPFLFRIIINLQLNEK